MEDNSRQSRLNQIQNRARMLSLLLRELAMKSQKACQFVEQCRRWLHRDAEKKGEYQKDVEYHPDMRRAKADAQLWDKIFLECIGKREAMMVDVYALLSDVPPRLKTRRIVAKPWHREENFDWGPIEAELKLIEDAAIFALVAEDREGGQSKTKPSWDPLARTLTFQGEVIKKFKNPAENQVLLVEAFEKAEWQEAINSPFKLSSTLTETIRELNRKACAIKFAANGDGKTCGWKKLP